MRTFGLLQSCKYCWFPTLSSAKTLFLPESYLTLNLSLRQNLWSSQTGFWKPVIFLNREWMSMFLKGACIAFNRSLKMTMTPRNFSNKNCCFSPSEALLPHSVLQSHWHIVFLQMDSAFSTSSVCPHCPVPKYSPPPWPDSYPLNVWLNAALTVYFSRLFPLIIFFQGTYHSL